VAESAFNCAYLCQDVRESLLVQSLQLLFTEPRYRIYLRAILPMSSHDAGFGSQDFRPFENDLSWEPGTEA
jgi:hypothetical protein